jgi:hypothetical protein
VLKHGECGVDNVALQLVKSGVAGGSD